MILQANYDKLKPAPADFVFRPRELGGWSTPKPLLGIYAHSNDELARNALEKVMFRR